MESTAARLASDGPAHLFDLWIDFDQAWSFEHAGLEIRMGVGDVLMTAPSDAITDIEPGKACVVELLVAHDWPDAWMRGVETRLSSPIRAGDGWGAVLSAFLRELTPQLCASGVLSPQVLADDLGSLLALIAADGAAAPGPAAQAGDGLNGRVRSAIRHRASTPRLTASDVALELGMSERTMHRVLAAGGEGFASLLSRYRIDVAKRMLESGAFDGLPVGEIGCRAGFTDPSYFIRTMVRVLGTTPSRYREERSAIEVPAR